MFFKKLNAADWDSTGRRSDTESNTKYKAAPKWLSMLSELFEFYTPTKDRLSKAMPEWIFHTERGSEGEEEKNRRPRDTGSDGEEEERGRKRQWSDAGSQENISCTV